MRLARSPDLTLDVRGTLRIPHTALRIAIRARARVQARIERIAGGNVGDVKPVGEGVSEFRVDYGPGYRVYFQKRGPDLAIPLADGDTRTQASDIRTALRLTRNL